MSNLHLMNHHNLIVVHFNSYAGGKFFINCLAHNPGILPGLCVASPIHTYDSWLFKNLDDFAQRKIARINSTIPPVGEMSKWPSYELGCTQFWGGLISQIIKGQDPSPESITLLKDNICFIVNHGVADSNIEQIVNIWPNARHIVLHNYTKFQTVAAKLKSGKYSISEVTILDNPAFFNVDVDNTYTTVNSVKLAVSNCIKWLGLDDKLHVNLDSYIKRYLALHRQ